MLHLQTDKEYCREEMGEVSSPNRGACEMAYVSRETSLQLKFQSPSSIQCHYDEPQQIIT